MTRKFLFSSATALILFGTLAMPALSPAAAMYGSQYAPVAAQPSKQANNAIGQSKTADVNGWAWQASSNEAKLSFLLGVENAIAMEYAMAQALAQQQGKTMSLSPFQEGWVAAFQETPRQQIVSRVDTYYKGHPDQRDRHVFDVIWTDMIVPAMAVKSPAPGK